MGPSENKTREMRATPGRGKAQGPGLGGNAALGPVRAVKCYAVLKALFALTVLTKTNSEFPVTKYGTTEAALTRPAEPALASTSGNY